MQAYGFKINAIFQRVKKNQAENNTQCRHAPLAIPMIGFVSLGSRWVLLLFTLKALGKAGMAKST